MRGNALYVVHAARDEICGNIRCYAESWLLFYIPLERWKSKSADEKQTRRAARAINV